MTQVRAAGPADVGVVAQLLDDVNREFDTATPGPDVLAGRLRRLLPGSDVVALLADEPAVGLALLTLRPSVWYDGPVGLLDELYVVPPLRGRGHGTTLLRAAEEQCWRAAATTRSCTTSASSAEPAASRAACGTTG